MYVTWVLRYCFKQEEGHDTFHCDIYSTYNVVMLCLVCLISEISAWGPKVPGTQNHPGCQYSIFPCNVYTWYGRVKARWDCHAGNWSKVRELNYLSIY